MSKATWQTKAIYIILAFALVVGLCAITIPKQTVANAFSPQFQADKTEVHVGEVVTFTNLYAQGKPPYTKAKWDFENDGIWDIILTGTHAQVMADVTHAYSEPGVYTVKLEMTDSAPTTRYEVRDYYIIVGTVETWSMPYGTDVNPATFNPWKYPSDDTVVTLADVEDTMPGELLVIWYYGGPGVGWKFFKPGWGADNTLTELVPGNIYFGIVSHATSWEIPIPSPPIPLFTHWPMYGHDSAHTSGSSINGPTQPSVKWTYNLQAGIQDTNSPVVAADGTVYMSSLCGFFAINSNGTLKWKKWCGPEPWNCSQTSMAPAIASDGSAVYYVSQWPQELLYALNPTNGDVIWSYDIGYTTYGSPTVGSDGTIYIGGAPDPAGPCYMYAIHPNGTLKWSWTSSMNNCWIETSPAIGQNGELYFLNNCFGVTALDSEGHLLWNEDGSLGEVWNSPSLGPDGTIYIGSSDHFFYALYPNGTIKWKVPVDAVNFMYESCSAISSDGSAIFHGDNGGLFYAFDKSGYVKWTYDTGINGVIQCAPALSANGIVYFTQGWTTSVQTGDKGYLYALRASDGSLLWKYEIGWSISSPAIAADGTLYAVGEDALGNAIVYSFGDE